MAKFLFRVKLFIAAAVISATPFLSQMAVADDYVYYYEDDDVAVVTDGDTAIVSDGETTVITDGDTAIVVDENTGDAYYVE